MQWVHNLKFYGIGILAALTLLFSAHASAGPLTAAEIDKRLEKFRGDSFVFVSWGGAYTKAQRNAFLDPFEKKYGVKIITDAPTNDAKLSVMVKSGRVTWDVYDTVVESGLKLGREGMLEALDYDIIDSRDVISEFVKKHFIGACLYGTVLAYRSDVFKNGNVPTKVQDLWDVKKFPGRRSMQDSPRDNLVFALQAEGVTKDQIYPISNASLDRAFKKLDAVKSDVVTWWSQGAQPAQLLADKEVVMATGWNGRIYDVQKQGLPVAVVWNQAHLSADVWAIVKGSKHKELAMLFIAWATLPENNVRLSNFISYAPVNKKSFKMVAKEMRPFMPTTYIDEILVMDGAWWVDNIDRVQDMWRKWKLK